jgi:hypothetical protein
VCWLGWELQAGTKATGGKKRKRGSTSASDGGAQEEEEEAQHMEVSAQLHGVCIGAATALGKRPDQQVRLQLALWWPDDE